ncbi:O-acyltransferase WSD1 [Sesamum alatum]|uniref:O-acyltransferase WSD1 n=1 Tax=Sesamum alatum TaxID=300844 RepID=A0AAE1Y5S0_9LAMI|nr:O-acyltransferase WSD1 [Sesamum alatum]
MKHDARIEDPTVKRPTALQSPYTRTTIYSPRGVAKTIDPQNSKSLSLSLSLMEEEAMERDQPLTPVGRLFMQPLLNQVINCAVTFEFPIDVDAFKAELRSSILLQHPRFCSLMVRDSGGRENWRKTRVDFDRHVIVRHQPLFDDNSISDDDAVNDFIADLSVSSPLSTDKPLWEIHLLMAHKTLLFRLHHALGDGISLMSMMLSCCRRVDDPSQPPTIGGVGAASSSPRRRAWSVWTLVKVVWYSLIYILEFSLRALCLKDKTTALSGGEGVELWPRRLATARFRLDDMKTVKRAVADATINDVLFGVISCGLSRYLNIKSPKALPEGLRLTGVSMVNLRPQAGLQDVRKLINSKSRTRWGNRFGMLLLPVYYHTGGSDPLQYVKRAKTVIDKKKLSLEATFSHNIGNFVMSLFGPELASIMDYRIVCNTTFIISNVVGPHEKITMAGNPALTMHMVSYAGVADMQIVVAKDIIPDPKVLVECFQNALLEMKVAAEAATKS